MMKFGFGSEDMGEGGDLNEMSYDFIYEAIRQDPQVKAKLNEVRLMIAELEREIEELKRTIELLKALQAAAAAAA